ncbi:MAG: DUF4307 domain-containing protein [Propionicimonas sp.]
METDAERLARRYPTRRSPLADWRLWAVVLGLIGLGWISWVAVNGAVPPVSARVDAFQAVSDTEIEVTVALEREDVGRGARCLVFVQAVSYERVGELELTVPPGGEHHTRQTVTVRTFKRGTSADVEGCRPTD